MSDDHDLERREFIVASLAAVSAPVVLAAGAAAVSAQEAAQPAATGGTVFTGDVIQGKRVLSALDVNDLEPGRHQFYFEGVQGITGQHRYVSVAVAKGAQPGRRVLLTSGVHGDEMSSVRTVQRVMEALDPAAMSGTVTAVFDISGPALEGMARRWPNSGRGVDLIDMNRVWPGDENAPEAPRRHAGLLFNRLLRPNADVAIDFHTVSSGMDGTAFHFADMSHPEVAEMAMLFPVDQIFADTEPYAGTLMNELVAVGIPALTPELGKPRVLDPEMISRFVEGTMNVLKLHGVIQGPMGRTGHDAGVFVAVHGAPVISTHGGFVELLVELREKVEAGQAVAVQYDAFGERIAEYASPVAGEIMARRTDATCEAGTPLMLILFTTEGPADAEEEEAFPE
ncbi:succinylglutamate desuccinylase/aspartoacylase family protein [Amaricoccus sp.]|uniref:succinylglutamate desuccinylase/aspartoacylase family protein n=1 Tax=Amaricoccus sp. TaxID=1872485 RepID=UPI00261224C1|nr:succinylglutamate desuccinylase/aspartoacylase family protein [Amaricoccus sp.]HRO09986.1 succinylglutamate desuccinylase/aspartoacylase family protein [Amaricoccus sp.]